MYSPSAKHAPHKELPFTFAFNIPVGSEDGKSTLCPHNGSLYACNTVFDASVMYHAVIR
jgi:hypothetical protein